MCLFGGSPNDWLHIFIQIDSCDLSVCCHLASQGESIGEARSLSGWGRGSVPRGATGQHRGRVCQLVLPLRWMGAPPASAGVQTPRMVPCLLLLLPPPSPYPYLFSRQLQPLARHYGAHRRCALFRSVAQHVSRSLESTSHSGVMWRTRKVCIWEGLRQSPRS
jgi:hypothetical protein